MTNRETLIEEMARKLCAADRKNPDYREQNGYWQIFDGRTGSGNQASRRWVEYVSDPMWTRYRHLAEAALGAA